MKDDGVFCLTQHGERWDSLEEQIRVMTAHDVDWQRGRHGAYVWYAHEDIEAVAHKAYGLFMQTNALNMNAFPSLAIMEAELVRRAAGLFGHPTGCGHTTSGGTESIFMAIFAAREWAKQHQRGLDRPNIVAAHSAHPALSKAAYYLGVDVIRVPVSEDYRADFNAMKDAINDQTIMLYASAPAYSLGIIDPVKELGDIATDYNVWLHVDACVGGILGPYVRKAGYPVTEFDFSIPGVTSISADLHKSGFCAKGASLILFRDEAHRECSRYTFTDWPSGAYSSPTFCGTRPGGTIAAAWAVQRYLGVEGHLRLAREVMQARETFVEGLRRIPGFHTLGASELWAVGFTGDGLNMEHLQRLLLLDGWKLGAFYNHQGLHMMFTPVHLPVVGELLQAIESAVHKLGQGVVPTDVASSGTSYS